MSKIGIACKTSLSHGFGHLVRQSHIARVLQSRGAEIIFFIPDYSPAQDWLDRCQFPHKTLNDPLALTEKETGPLDLIILDITMPFFDGMEWLEITRRYSKHADLPIVMLSGKTSDSDISGALEKGAVAYLTKPLDANELLAVISEQLATASQTF